MLRACQFMRRSQRGPLLIITAAVATLAVVGASKHFLSATQCENPVVTVNLRYVQLPYKTEDGASLSMDGLPRGRFDIPAGGEITQIELSAIMLDPEQNLIKQVLMIGGNFPDDAEFELSDRFQHNPINKAKVVDRITLDPTGTNTKYIYLFAPPRIDRWKATKIAVIELDDFFPISHLAIRQADNSSEKWIQGTFMPTNEPIEAKYAQKNGLSDETEVSYIYGKLSDCPSQ